MEWTLTSFILPIASLGTMLSGLVALWGLIRRKKSASYGTVDTLLDKVARSLDENNREMNDVRDDVKIMILDGSNRTISDLFSIKDRISKADHNQMATIKDLEEIKSKIYFPALMVRIQRLIDEMLENNADTRSIIELIDQLDKSSGSTERERETKDG